MYTINAIYAIIITYCIAQDRSIQDQFNALSKFTQITFAMRKHIFDFLSEYMISKDNSPSEFSSAITPRLPPIIYKLVGAEKFFYRNTDIIKYKSMLQARVDIIEHDMKHKRAVKIIDDEIKISCEVIQRLEEKREDIHTLFVEKKIDEEERNFEYIEIEQGIMKQEDLIRINQDRLDTLNAAYQTVNKKLEENTIIDYVKTDDTDVVLEFFSFEQMQLMSAEVKSIVDSSTIFKIVKKNVSDGPIMNHQIFSTIVSRLSTENKTLYNDIILGYNQKFSRNGYEQSDYFNAITEFQKTMIKERKW